MSAAVKVQRNFYLNLLQPGAWLQIQDCNAADKLPIKLFTTQTDVVATMHKINEGGFIDVQKKSGRED